MPLVTIYIFYKTKKKDKKKRILLLTMKYKNGKRDWIGRAADRKIQLSYVNF